MKSNKSKKKAASGISKKQFKNKPGNKELWEKVKLSGNLLSDDGGANLEGLLGLEVLENYDRSSIKKQKHVIAKKLKNNFRERNENSDESEAEQSRPSKNERKKKKKLQKNSNKKRTQENGSPEVEPGRFVRPIQDNKKKQKNGKKKGKKSKQQTSNDESITNSLSMDDLTGWNSFGIPEPILRVIAEKGFKEPTEIQAQSFPAAIMGRRDILGAAETGSGKTLAFGIPIITGILHMKKNPGTVHFRKITKADFSKIEMKIEEKTLNKSQQSKSKKKPVQRNRDERENCTPPPEEINNFPDFPEINEVSSLNDNSHANAEPSCDSKPLYALVLTPTRELAVQVKDHLVAICKYTDIQIATVFGGLAAVKQERVLSKCPEIVVATPGRLWELINEGNPHLNKLQNINFLVVDETDRMIEKGHFEELRLILERLNCDSLKKAQRQNFIFSATLTLIHELPQYLKLKNMNRKRKFKPETIEQKLDSLIQYFDIQQPKIVDITTTDNSSSGIAKKITECRISCSHEQKDLYLYYFLQKHPGRTIVFCNSIECVRRLAKLFAILQCEPLALHAKMAQRARLKSLERFTKNTKGILVATDVAARGLDIPNVEHVIHYQVPRTSENYIHRSGRTARGSNEGIAILLMEPKEINEYVKLCRTLKRSDDLPIFPVADRYLDAVRERVDLARKVDVAELRVRRQQADIGWLKKSAKEMDILIDDESDFSEADFYGSDTDDAGGAERIKARRDLKHMKDSLKHSLAKPIFPKGVSYKYPSAIQLDENISNTIKIELGNQTNEKEVQGNAVNTMKNAIEDYNNAKKKRKQMNSVLRS